MKTKSPRKLGALHRKIKRLYIYRKIREQLVYISYMLSKKKSADLKCVVFTQGRAGSELLASMLNQHDHIYLDGESLYFKVMSPSLYIKAQSSIYANKVYGFKVKLEQLEGVQDLNPHEYIMNLYQDGWKIIYLQRKDLLKQALSNLVATERKQWHVEKEDDSRQDKVEIDLNTLLARMKKLRMDTEKESMILSGIPHLKIVYEDDLFNSEAQQVTVDKIFEYLGVDSIPVQVPLARTSTNKMEDTVLNYSEMCKTVESSEFSSYL